jgi:murein DD-endopeptidase MepM/ murein hydrolase activator NlpD
MALHRLLENQKVEKKSSKVPLFLFTALFLIMVLASTFLFSSPFSSPSSEEIEPALTESQRDLDQSPVQDISNLRTVNGKIKRDQTFYDLMLQYGSTPQEIHQMASAAKEVFNLGKLMTGRSYELTLDDDDKLCLVKYNVDPENTFVIQTAPDSYNAYMEKKPFDIFTRRVDGVIKSSLFEAVQEIGEGPELAVMLSEIFAWDIDFHFDIREGDRFTVFFEEKWQNGEFFTYGRILAAEFINQGDKFHAVYFEGSDGKSGYFTPEGKSLQKQFLRSPLKFKRISSKFTYKRFHPVLKRYRPHLGVDYVAPRGTPVHAAGDGKVIFAGRKGGNGNFVKIRHNQIYMTGYLHLSRIARGIRSGKRVKQGQVIGYVGKTGLATGPHLCYRFYKYGKFVNPLTVKFPSASPVPGKDMKVFSDLQERLMPRLLKPSPIYRVDRYDYLIAGKMSIGSSFLS